MKRHEKIRIGVIGCGTIFQAAYKPALREMRDIEVAYLYDIDRDVAAREASSFSARAARTADEIFEDGEVVFVIIATPPFARREYILKACSSGKHIIMEKPLASTRQDCQVIFEAVRKSRVRCWIPFWRQVHPVGRKMVELLSDKKRAGEPMAYYHTHVAPLYPWVKDPNNWVFDGSKNGGSLFYDFGIHFLEFALSTFGMPAAVSFRSSRLNKEISCDDSSSILLEFRGGKRAVLSDSWLVPKALPFEHHTNTVITTRCVIHQPSFMALSWRSCRGAGEYRATDDDVRKCRVSGIREFARCIVEGRPAGCNIKGAYQASMTYFNNWKRPLAAAHHEAG